MTADQRDDRFVRFREAITRLVRELPWRSATLWLIVVVNVALIALYFWSRSGQEITVHIEAIGTRYAVTVDGKKVASGEFRNHAAGGVGIRLKPNDHIASIAGPVGIDSLKITDAGTGRVLFDDDLSGRADKAWRVTSGIWTVHSGVLTTRTGGLIGVTDPKWQDYFVDAKLRNVEDVNMFVWMMKDPSSSLEVDLSFFRGYRTLTQQWRGGAFVASAAGQSIQLNEGQSIRSITAMMLRPYPAMLALILITTLIALAAGWLRSAALEERLRSAGEQILNASSQLVMALGVFAFSLLWYILYFVSDNMPHVPDSVLYVFQSKIFASFRLTAPSPPGSLATKTSESFSIFHPHMDQVVDGRWFSHYPFGHPMFLAIGQLVHMPSLVPPLLGAGCIVLIYLIGRRVYSTSVGLLAAALLLFSPFFQMTASNYMSHNTAAFVILACLAFYTWKTERRWAAMAASGLCFGLLFNIRPLPAMAFMFPLAGFMAYEFVRAGSERRARLVQYAAFAAGAMVMFGLYMLYNRATTGDPFKSGYAEQGTFSDDTFGFGGAHTVAFGLQNQRQLLGLMQLVANGWPAFAGFGIAMLPFLMGSRYRWDYFLAATFLSLAALNIFYKNPAVMNGPRFWYESLPFLMLLTARGAIYLRDGAVGAAEWIRSHLSGERAAPARAIAGTWVLGVMAALVAFSASGWMLQTREAWASIPFTPAKISELENFNFSDDRLLTRADDMHLHNALVFVRKCTGWWCYGSEFWTNSPTLDNDVVWAEQQQNGYDVVLLDHYPSRKLYLADYDAHTIVPVTRQEIEGQATGFTPPGVRP
jgi:4-amino-4-deoxy-L-arabinose transferase-like glycosyltransferase